MVFAGCVEDHLPLFQQLFLLARGHIDFALVRIDKFPKVMTFAGEGIVRAIFKIMYRINAVDAQHLFQLQCLIAHLLAAPLLWKRGGSPLLVHPYSGFF